MRFFGILFLTLLFSVGITILDIFLPGSYLIKFIDNSFIETFAALIGFNLASVTFLLGQLITIEATTNKESLFDSTRMEVKHNAYFLICSFLFSLFLLTIRPDMGLSEALGSNIPYYIFNALIISTFLMALFSIFEILKAVFSVGKFFKQNNPK